MKRIYCFSAALIMLIASGCNRHPQNESVESKRMQAEVVPQLLSWAKSPAKELQLSTLEGLQTFDYVCSVWQYKAYDDIKQIVGPIDRFYGAYVGSVPENLNAFIGVKDRRAHVAHFDMWELNIYGGTACVSPKISSLVRKEEHQPASPQAAFKPSA